MSTTIDIIETIDVEEILKKLAVPYIIKGSTIYLDDSDGWKGHATKGIFKDWANKGRAEGDRLAFVQSYLGVSRHEALNWFEQSFNIDNTYKKEGGGNTENPIQTKWENLPPLTQEQISYLQGRGIDFSLLDGIIKNNNGQICMPIRKLDGRITSLQSRNIMSTGGRYFLEAGADSNGVFFNKIDNSKKALLVVEGFTDFLTLRQYTENVYGLLNAGNDEQLDMLKKLSRQFSLYFIPDNDEAGQQAKHKMEKKGIKFHTFELESYGVKDLNDLVTAYHLGKDILLAEIKNESIPPLTNITTALNKMKANIDKGRVFLKDIVLDKYLRGIRRGTTLLINGQSTGGKTTFSLYMLIHLLKNTTERIHYYSLETDIGEQILAIMSFYYGVSEKEILADVNKYDVSLFEDRLFIYDDMRTFEEIKTHVKAEMPDIFFIDFVQKLKIEGIYDETARMVYYAQEMQNFLIDLGHPIGISLSQVAMSNYQAPLINRTPKNSGALLESSDVVINVGKDLDGAFKIGFYKCKGGIGWQKVFNTIFDMEKKTYIILDEVFETVYTKTNNRNL